MTFVAIVIAFLLDQVRPTGTSPAVTAWLRRWICAVARQVDAGAWRQAWLAWALAVVVPTLAVGLAGWLCARIADRFGLLAWTVAVLYFTLGFRQSCYHFTAIRKALAASDGAMACDLLAQWRDEEEAGYFGSDMAARAREPPVVRRAIMQAMLSAHCCVFGVLFWVCLFAPMGFASAGAVLYRCAGFAARYWRHKNSQGEPVVSPALLAAACTAWYVIDWLPARVTALVFAVVGNFEDAIAAWRHHGTEVVRASEGEGNDAVLLAAAAGALGMRLDKGIDDAPGVKTERAFAVKHPAATQTHAVDSPFPPGWEPTVSMDEAEAVSVGPALFGIEPDVRHFAQVAGLLWRGVVAWLLLVLLLTFAHVLG